MPDKASLKPCPFCGGKNLKTGSRDFTGYMECKDCKYTMYFWGETPTPSDKWNLRAGETTCSQN